MADALFPALTEMGILLEKYLKMMSSQTTSGTASSNGKPVIGWFCSYTPLEIFHAAGLHTYRIIPEPGRAITRSDGYIDRNFCPYVRTCLGEALDGKYKFLSGLVIVNSCDSMRRMHDVWRYNIGGAFNYLLDLPRVNNAEAAVYFRENLHQMIKTIESVFDVEITDFALAEAVKKSNTGRVLLKALYQSNCEKGRVFSAIDIRTIIRANASLPVDIFNGFSTRLLEETAGYQAENNNNPRILITGSVMDNPQILRLIEECGADVVSDDLCNGTRQFWDMVQVSSDPLMDLTSILAWSLLITGRRIQPKPSAETFQSSLPKLRYCIIISRKQIYK